MLFRCGFQLFSAVLMGLCSVLVRYLGVQLREAGGAVLRREPRHGHQGAHGTVQAHQGKGQLPCTNSRYCTNTSQENDSRS